MWIVLYRPPCMANLTANPRTEQMALGKENGRLFRVARLSEFPALSPTASSSLKAPAARSC